MHTITLHEDQRPGSSIFSRLRVKDAMRQQSAILSSSDTLKRAVRTLIKNKIDGLLILDHISAQPAGVVTKTELMGAYYAALPLSTALGDIMASPVIQCSENDNLESALTIMHQNSIHRVFVARKTTEAMGSLSYPDIVGTLYKFCYHCRLALHRKRQNGEESSVRYRIKDVMTSSVLSVHDNETIAAVIEKLSAYRLGALLVVDQSNTPTGVISKTDLIIAYLRGRELTETAGVVANGPVMTCSNDTTLEEGIRTMIFSETSRLFVHGLSKNHIVGVISLTDMARLRSGSCQACSGSRIKVKKEM